MPPRHAPTHPPVTGYRGGSLGAVPGPGGTTFRVYSKHASQVDLLLFDRVEDVEPARVISLDPQRHRIYHYWSVTVPDVAAGQIYGFRAHGPWDPTRARRFDSSKVLLDPYGRAVAVPSAYDRRALHHGVDNAATAMKSVVVDTAAYDWEGDTPLRIPSSRTVIYEMHVGAFTRHPSSGVTAERRGTYAGLIEKIPYLQQLGVTSVELLPVFHFDTQDAPDGRSNFWGYAPVSFFAPHPGYSSTPDPLGAVDEFRDLVKALHRAGIEVILDVVYNHTAEGGDNGPTLCFRGWADKAYYMHERPAGQPLRYANHSGTGNTLNASHPVVRRLILDSLRYWVQEMHVDGFRFDLASILSRDANGAPLRDPAVLWDIESDPVLAGTKLIAEAWDAGGLYQVGSFVGDAWKEWNGRFRDDVRDFVRGRPGMTGALASRLLGSPDIYAHKRREAEQSINFVTCHDGFTLNDLVSYDAKHNLANGEANRDGCDDNRSWNHGCEGPSDDPRIEGMRERQVRNLLVLTMMSLGTPMILMGDEVRRSQDGNNNAYCQDNPLGWFDWSLVERHAGLLRFARMLISQRTRRSTAAEEQRLDLSRLLTLHGLTWHGVQLDRPDWSPSSHCLALTTASLDGGRRFHFMFNGWSEDLPFELPTARGGWRRWIDTAQPSPSDIVPLEQAEDQPTGSCRVTNRSIVVLTTTAT